MPRCSAGARSATTAEPPTNAEREPTLPELVARLSPVDLVIVEGYKHEPYPKIEVHRSGSHTPLLYPGDSHVVAVATCRALFACNDLAADAPGRR